MSLASSILEYFVTLRYFTVMFVTYSGSDFTQNSGTVLIDLSGQTTATQLLKSGFNQLKFYY